MERDEFPRVARMQVTRNTSQETQKPFAQLSSITYNNSRISNETLVARQLAWIGDRMEIRILSAGSAGNVQRLLGRRLATVGDILEVRHQPFLRRRETFLRLIWREYCCRENKVLVFASALLQLCYLVVQHMSWNLRLFFQLSVTQDSVTHYTYSVVLKTQGKTIVFSGLKKSYWGL